MRRNASLAVHNAFPPSKTYHQPRILAAVNFCFHASNMARSPKHFVTLPEQLFRATCVIFIVSARILPIGQKNSSPCGRGPVGQEWRCSRVPKRESFGGQSISQYYCLAPTLPRPDSVSGIRRSRGNGILNLGNKAFQGTAESRAKADNRDQKDIYFTGFYALNTANVQFGAFSQSLLAHSLGGTLAAHIVA